MGNKILFAITAIFNLTPEREELYARFVRRMNNFCVTLLTVEIAKEDRGYWASSGYGWNLRLISNSDLWQKERALNLGYKKVIEEFPFAPNIAFLDADISFLNPNWALDTVKELHKSDVIQLFSECLFLNQYNEMSWRYPSRFSNTSRNGHPGLAWAFTRDAIDKLGGLFDVSIMGDVHMANALLDDTSSKDFETASPGLKRAFDEWKEKTTGLNTGFIRGACCHYWHGDPYKRDYLAKWKEMCASGFDPYTDLQVAENGLYELKQK
jgi:hypothetical protein